ncbi:MAG: von Willebrand factor type A domain-containing protein [Pseudomonadota bacterium]
MTDPFDDLTKALKSATPAPDTAARDAHLRAADAAFEKNLAPHQEPAPQARPISDRAGWTARTRDGVRTMLTTLTSRGGLAASTALVAVGIVFLTPVGDRLPLPGRAPAPVEPMPIMAEPAVPPAPIMEEMDSEAGDRFRAAPTTLAEEAPLGRTAPVALGSAPQAGLQSADGAVQAIPLPAPIPEPVVRPEADTEAFANAEVNPVKVTAETPVSTFSVDVDTASYAVVRSSLIGGQLPPKDAVRVEEMINYFPYAYPAPDGDMPFTANVSVFETPWNADTRLMRVALQGELPAIADRPALNLVFLIDTSGSMQAPNKLELLKQSLRLMLPELRPDDQIAMVTYAGSAGVALEPTPASDRTAILGALDGLTAGGSTAGQAGLEAAYRLAEDMHDEGEVGRILLATDGDFNVGLSDVDALKDYIADKRDSGTYLSVLGFGRGNLDDATMQALAQNGNGQAAYIDSLSEARKALVDQLTGALFPIAEDVKIQVEFNPAAVAEYRLIGYETRALKREDFNNDRVDAGEIGAGHAVTALYEVTPVGSPAILNDPLRYAATNTDDVSDEEMALLRLRWKAPGADDSTLFEQPVANAVGTPDSEAQFAAAIAGFGQLLRGSDYLGDWGWGDAAALASAARGEDSFGYRAEAVTLIRLAESLAAQ